MRAESDKRARRERRATAEMGRVVVQTRRGRTGVRSTRDDGDSVDPTWTSTLPDLCLAGNIMGHKGNKVEEVNINGVMMVNGRGWESSRRRESRSGREDLHGRINLLPPGLGGEKSPSKGGEEVHDLSPSKGDHISMGGQDLICNEVKAKSFFQNEVAL